MPENPPVVGWCCDSKLDTLGDTNKWCWYGQNKDAYWRPWKPSTQMPQWASRIKLRVKSVRLERIQVITDSDARAEGVGELFGDGPVPDGSWGYTASGRFSDLWDMSNKKDYCWQKNPYVWVYEFEKVE